MLLLLLLPLMAQAQNARQILDKTAALIEIWQRQRNTLYQG